MNLESNIDKIIIMFNQELHKLSFNKICDKYNIKHKRLNTVLKRKNYYYDRNTNQIECITKSSIKDKTINNTKRTIEDNIKRDTMYNTKCSIDTDKLSILLKRYDELIALLDKNKSNNNKSNNKKIIIDLPVAEDKQTSVRVNKDIWNEFKIFTTKHDFYSTKELLSQAIKEFIEKYK